MTENLKNRVTARYLSLFVPGLGQLYAGRILRSIIVLTSVVLLTVSIVGLLVVPFVWYWNIVDAGEVADQYNQRALLKTVEGLK